MSKVIDITDKLNFDVAPSLKVKDKIFEVNCDAPTMLKIMALMSKDVVENKDVLEMFDLIFPEQSKEAIAQLKLNFDDLIVVVREAVQLVTGNQPS